MHAERQAFKADCGDSNLVLERLHIDAYLHLRSAGRGTEVDALAEVAEQKFGHRLATGGLFMKGASATSPAVFCAMRTRPSEIVVWAMRQQDDTTANNASELLASCQAAVLGSSLLHVVDGTHGQAAFLLGGSGARALLQRVADATSMPVAPGTAVRLRLADLHVTLTWAEDNQYVLIVDVLYAEFLAERVAYAAAAMASTS